MNGTNIIFLIRRMVKCAFKKLTVNNNFEWSEYVSMLNNFCPRAIHSLQLAFNYNNIMGCSSWEFG